MAPPARFTRTGTGWPHELCTSARGIAYALAGGGGASVRVVASGGPPNGSGFQPSRASSSRQRACIRQRQCQHLPRGEIARAAHTDVRRGVCSLGWRLGRKKERRARTIAVDVANWRRRAPAAPRTMRRSHARLRSLRPRRRLCWSLQQNMIRCHTAGAQPQAWSSRALASLQQRRRRC